MEAENSGLTAVLGAINDYLYGYVLVGLLVLVGIFFTVLMLSLIHI